MDQENQCCSEKIYMIIAIKGVKKEPNVVYTLVPGTFTGTILNTLHFVISETRLNCNQIQGLPYDAFEGGNSFLGSRSTSEE